MTGFAGREETSDEVAVLHYTYNKFDDLKSRRDRCDCAPTEDDAKRCFILPFDRMVGHSSPLVSVWRVCCRRPALDKVGVAFGGAVFFVVRILWFGV